MSNKKSILLVDDDDEIVELIKECFEEEDYRIVTADNGLLGLRKFKNETFDLVITDIFMPKVNGIELIKELKSESETGEVPVPVIVISGQIKDFRAQIVVLDNVSFLEKPFKTNELVSMANQLINPGKSVIEDMKKTYQAGDVLLKEGEPGRAMFYVLKGRLKVSKMESGGEVVLNEIKFGELVGEMSIVDDRPRSATVTAMEETEVIEIPHHKFANILSSLPQWMKILVKNLSLRLRETNQKIGQ